MACPRATGGEAGRPVFGSVYLIQILGPFVRSKNPGLVGGADGMLKLWPGMVRIPDVAFVSWGRVPGGRVPDEPIPNMVPDLVVEVLSEGNTAGEMDRKRSDYIKAGVRLAWFVDPRNRSVAVYTSPDTYTVLTEAGTLGGGNVLLGFSVPASELFAEPQAPASVN